MKKKIYAVKCGRKTGIFKEWQTCSQQVDQYPYAAFQSFEYRSECAEEPENVPGSLRGAIQQAKEFLGDLVYLGGSDDCLKDAGWAEEGFLPFGKAPKTQPLAPASGQSGAEDAHAGETEDAHAEETEAADAPGTQEEGTWDAQSWGIEYWRIAQEMRECIEIISGNQALSGKRLAATKLKGLLEKCLDDLNLRDLTQMYRNHRMDNAIGFDPPLVARFVLRMERRYPKP